MTVLTQWVAVQVRPESLPQFRGQLRNWRAARRWAGAGTEYHRTNGRVACYASQAAAQQKADELNA